MSSLAESYHETSLDHKTFASVARQSSIRTLLALGVKNDLNIHQLDIGTAYLNVKLEEKIFMELPNLFEEILLGMAEKEKLNKTKAGQELARKITRMLSDVKIGNKVCILKRSLYGLRQAGRQWNKRIDQELHKLEMKFLESDPCVYIAKRVNDIMLLAVYVDGMLLAS